MSQTNDKLGHFINSERTHECVAILIVLNALVLGAETYESMRPYLNIIQTIDYVFLGLFSIELLVRIRVDGLSFFRNGWNVFDTAIVLISVVSMFPMVSILRVVRIIRIMRLISMFPKMRVIISAIYMAVPGIFSISCLLFMMFYVFSVIAYNLFHEINPVLFNSLGGSMYTLFQLMLCDEWSLITRPILEKMPYSWLFFIPFIIIMTFSILNLLFGLIVNAMQKAAEGDKTLAEIKSAYKKGTTQSSDHVNVDTIHSLETKVDTLLHEIQSLKTRIAA
jgi:voltage-gated sodium channel